MSASSTLVAVVGDTGGEVVRRVGAGSSNVGVEVVSDKSESRSHAVRSTWQRARRHGLVYTLVNCDPLEMVVSEWGKRLIGTDNELEIAIGTAGSVEMPDYYVVDENLGSPLIDWYLANLREMAPSRVVPVKMEPGPLAARLANLPYGRPFPSTVEVVNSARAFVPLPELVAIEREFD